MPDLTCERCGLPVLFTRPPRAGVPPKRFCSSRCQLAAQKSRWKARRRAAAKEGKKMADTPDQYDQVRPVLQMAQRLHMSLHQKLMEKGVEPIDALIASASAAYTLGCHVHGSPIASIEWLRTAIDTIERQVMEKLN